MTDETPVSVRLPPKLLKRADALAAKLQKDPEVRMLGRVSRSAVLRLAVLKGLQVLEAEYSSKKK